MTPQIQIVPVASTDVPMALLLEADPNEAKVLSYLPEGLCYVAKEAEAIVGVYVLVQISATTVELMNIAVEPICQGWGIGTQLLHHAIQMARQKGTLRLEVGTGTFGYQQAFYQRAGFRVIGVERDFFLDNYTEPIWENGLQHKDMLRLAIEF